MNLGKEKEYRECLKSLFDPSAPGMSPFRALYNLEVLYTFSENVFTTVYLIVPKLKWPLLRF